MKTGSKCLSGALFLLLILSTCVLAAPVPTLVAPIPEVATEPSGFIQIAQTEAAPPITTEPTTPAPTPPPTTPKPTEAPPEPTLYAGYIIESSDVIYEAIETEAPTRRPMIALTFDDGPSRFTAQILDTLAQYDARATFFVLGERVTENPLTTRRIVREEHEILGHSWNHRDMSVQSRANISSAITRTSSVLYGVAGVRTQLFRPPYGAFNARVREVAAELGYALVMWTVDPQDWRLRNQCVDYLYNHIINNAYDGAIVVLHDVFASTADAMELVIPRLIADGFELVTVTELLEYFFGEIVPGRVYYGIWR